MNEILKILRNCWKALRTAVTRCYTVWSARFKNFTNDCSHCFNVTYWSHTGNEPSKILPILNSVNCVKSTLYPITASTACSGGNLTTFVFVLWKLELLLHAKWCLIIAAFSACYCWYWCMIVRVSNMVILLYCYVVHTFSTDNSMRNSFFTTFS